MGCWALEVGLLGGEGLGACAGRLGGDGIGKCGLLVGGGLGRDEAPVVGCGLSCC